MTFAYQDYLFNNLLIPVLAVVFICIPLFQMVGRVIRQLVHGERPEFGDAKSKLLLILMVVILVIIISTLFRGSIHLIYERPGDAVTIEGTIENIDKLSSFEGVRYTSNGETTFGYQYTVDGTVCTGMALGSLEVGDEVTVTYLPNSGYVLEIQQIQP